MAQPTVLISSLGLMGGSLAAALQAADWRVLLHHRRPEVAHEAQRRGFGLVTELGSALAEADLCVVCTPVSVIAETVRTLAAYPGRAVFTDVGSVKRIVCAALIDLAEAGRFVGSHPMCGSHQTGLDAADARLYQQALCVVTPAPAGPASATLAVEQLWHAAGARVQRMDPDAHDRAVVAASHLPHILGSCAASQLDDEAAPLAASGFRDTTRVAASAAALWSDILLANRTAVQAGLNQAHQHLTDLAAALAAGDHDRVTAWLEAGRSGRARFDVQTSRSRPV